MTIEAPVATRPVIRDWPMFAGWRLPENLDAVRIEVLRSYPSSIEDAVRVTSEVLRDALFRAVGEHSPLWLVATRMPAQNPTRLQSYLLEKRKMWSALEERGFRLPPGIRCEYPMTYPGNYHGFGGRIDLPLDGLADAMEVARRENAVCVGSGSGDVDDLCTGILHAATPTYTRWNLFLAAVGLLSGSQFAIRSYGDFDDRENGVEIFAFDPLLDKVEEAVGQRGTSSGW